MTLVLLYNPPVHADLSEMAPADRQAFTTDRRRFGEADAVVFHLPTLQRIDALAKPAGQIWVLWSMESVANYPAMADPRLLQLFDLTMTYQRTADIWTPYIPGRETWRSALQTAVPEKTATAPAVMFQSSLFNRSGRIGYAAELMKAIRVDSFGRVLNNKALPAGDLGRDTKLSTIGRYKFCISLENSVCDDYVTEKFFDPLLAGTVPVYLGARNVDSFAPGDGCYIDVRDFAGPRRLAEYLHALDRDDAAYRRLLAWRSAPLRGSLAADIARASPALTTLLQAVEARRAQPAPARDSAVVLSYDPAHYGPLDPGRTTVASVIYDPPAGRGRLARWRAWPMRLARRGAEGLRAARRLLGGPGGPPRP